MGRLGLGGWILYTKGWSRRGAVEEDPTPLRAVPRGWSPPAELGRRAAHHEQAPSGWKITPHAYSGCSRVMLPHIVYLEQLNSF